MNRARAADSFCTNAMASCYSKENFGAILSDCGQPGGACHKCAGIPAKKQSDAVAQSVLVYVV
jgi:hypothetical protein